jgi:hypothetical protein
MIQLQKAGRREKTPKLNLKAAIHQSAHDNYVGPWLSSFLKRRGL